MKTATAVLLFTLTGSPLWASSLYDHRAVCNNDKSCMEEQVVAYSLWHNQKWDYELKKSCKHYATRYPKDYVKAVDCVKDLQFTKQQYRLNESEVRKNEAEADRRDGNRYKFIIRRDK